MAKDTYYFSHDYNARNDPKILELRSEYGMEGLGIYWCIIETLAEDDNGYIVASLMGGLSVGFSIPKGRLIEIVEFMVKIDLLCKDEIGIYSRRMMEHKTLRKTLSDKGKEGALKRWKNSPPNSPPNAKERKGKENNINIPLWKTDFKVYLSECNKAYKQFYNDDEFIKLQSQLNPNVNVKLSIAKGYENFWKTEAGWKHKKKSRTNEIDWKQTIINSIDMNKVYFTKQELAEMER